uniref:Ig-like domain-containing protein n=1 Tax=Hucho hucho TaxID=62062 RepID=A0A4W5N6D1_9TELE
VRSALEPTGRPLYLKKHTVEDKRGKTVRYQHLAFVEVFTIRSVTLTLEPSNAVSQGTNVTVRCKALASSSGFLNREYTIYKDNTVVYTKSSTTTEDLLYSLRMARVANTGKYKCKVNIQGKELSINSEKLTLTGLQTPVLSVDKRVFSEGEEVTVWCKGP